MSTPGKETSVVAIQRVTLPLYKVNCASDTQAVEHILKQVAGVATVYANPASEKVYIEYDGAFTDPGRLRTALEEAGFGQKTLQVTCSRCRRLPGDASGDAADRQKHKPLARWWSLWW